MPVDCSYNPRYYCFGETNKHCVVGVGELITWGGEVWCHNVPLTKWKVTVQHDHLSFPGVVIAA